MFAYLWPICLLMIANILYQICAKEVPAALDAFATLVICYGVAIVISVAAFFITSDAGIDGLLAEYSKINWAVIALGVTAVGLEVGYVFCYKIGWEVSMAYMVQAAAMSIMLLFVGYFLYSEGLSWNKIAGVALCLGGLIMINKRGAES